MAIPAQHAHRRIYHFTHIDNLPALFERGFLANNHPNFPRDRHRTVAAPGIQNRRSEMRVTCGPRGVVHDYVPLYFGSLSPMLLGVVNKKNVDQFDIVYFEFPISLLDSDHVVFTDSSANTNVPPNFYSDPARLDNLNWLAIDSIKWGCPTEEYRHQRMAEVLVYQHLPIGAAMNIVVWNEGVQEAVRAVAAEAGVRIPEVSFEDPARRHYFENFTDNKGYSIVMGPKALHSQFSTHCEYIIQKEGVSRNFRFRSASHLLESLRCDFSCTPPTSELVGLRSENGVHKLTVDLHTLAVVGRLVQSPGFADLPHEARVITELAAYLHDVGKGPRARWASNGGVQKVDPDHPGKAMPILAEFFTTLVAPLPRGDLILLMKLVCYHDLIGEVMGKGRDKSQILDVVRSELELRMLFEIGKADATALSDMWWNDAAADDLFEECLDEIQVP